MLKSAGVFWLKKTDVFAVANFFVCCVLFAIYCLSAGLCQVHVTDEQGLENPTHEPQERPGSIYMLQHRNLIQIRIVGIALYWETLSPFLHTAAVSCGSTCGPTTDGVYRDDRA